VIPGMPVLSGQPQVLRPPGTQQHLGPNAAQATQYHDIGTPSSNRSMSSISSMRSPASSRHSMADTLAMGSPPGSNHSMTPSQAPPLPPPSTPPPSFTSHHAADKEPDHMTRNQTPEPKQHKSQLKKRQLDKRTFETNKECTNTKE
jgi:hypothetical protein